ncbi:MAG: RNA polymerase sigma factor [Chitinophagales bacterium]
MLDSSEQKLLSDCLKGVEKAQKKLYEQYKVQMFRICLRYAANRQEAEDILQDGFVKIFMSLHQYKKRGSLGAWMRKVMINVALQHIRKHKNSIKTADLEKALYTYSTQKDIFSDLGAKELTAIIQKLPKGYRLVFNLYVIEGFSHKEIAEMLQISESTSKSQLFKAKKTLRKVLSYIISH